MRQRLIVVGGYATSGKDAVANILVDRLGWYKTYMSKPLEQALLALDPWVPWLGEKPRPDSYWVRYSELHARVGYDESKKNPEVRRLLQALGSEVGRDLMGENVWLNKVLEEVNEQLEIDKNVVVTGIRYPNEMRAFKALSGESLWVTRPGVQAVNTHSSDNTLTQLDFDILCENTGTLEDLRIWVTSYFEGE